MDTEQNASAPKQEAKQEPVGVVQSHTHMYGICLEAVEGKPLLPAGTKLYDHAAPCSKCAELADELASEKAKIAQARYSRDKSAEKLSEAERQLAHIKEVEFPRRVAKVAEGWRKKVEAAERQRDELLAALDDIYHSLAWGQLPPAKQHLAENAKAAIARAKGEK